MPSRPLLVLPGRCSAEDVAALAATLRPLVRAGLSAVAAQSANETVQPLSNDLPVVFVHDPALPARQVESMGQRIMAGIPGLPGTDVVVATSGSSGRPRLVGISARALTHSCLTTVNYAEGGREDDPTASQLHWVLALPTFHVAGLLVVWRALLQGTAPHVVDLTRGFSPELLSACLQALPAATAVVSLVPTQLQRVLASPANTRALSRAKVVLVGGAALAPSLAAAAAAARVKVATTYGMTETCGGCVYDGSPLDGVQVHVEATGPAPVLPPGEATGPAPVLPPGEATMLKSHAAPSTGVGRIYLRHCALAEGYLGEPELTAAAFPELTAATFSALPPDAQLPGGPQRWHRTADLGTWDGHSLRVLGRADDLINTGGEKVPPAAVEAALLATGLVSAACVVGVPDEHWGQAVVAIIVPAPPPPSQPAPPPPSQPSEPAQPLSAPPSPAPRGTAHPKTVADALTKTVADALTETVADALTETLAAAAKSWPPAWRPKRIVVQPELPLLPGGKVDKMACQNLAMTGVFTTPSNPSPKRQGTGRQTPAPSHRPTGNA